MCLSFCVQHCFLPVHISDASPFCLHFHVFLPHTFHLIMDYTISPSLAFLPLTLTDPYLLASPDASPSFLFPIHTLLYHLSFLHICHFSFTLQLSGLSHLLLSLCCTPLLVTPPSPLPRTL